MSKTNIIMGNPTYFINPEEGIIVCSIKTFGRIWNYPNLTLNGGLGRRLKKKFNFHLFDEGKTFTAVARLHKEDTWDEVKGKRIAESKCKRKIYDFYSRLYIDMFNEIVKRNIKVLNKHIDNLDYCADREAKHLEKLMK